MTEQVCDGLDRTATTMKKGEVAELTIAPEYAFGSSGSQQDLALVPPDSTVFYQVEMVSFTKVSGSVYLHDLCSLLCFLRCWSMYNCFLFICFFRIKNHGT